MIFLWADSRRIASHSLLEDSVSRIGSRNDGEQTVESKGQASVSKTDGSKKMDSAMRNEGKSRSSDLRPKEGRLPPLLSFNWQKFYAFYSIHETPRPLPLVSD